MLWGFIDSSDGYYKSKITDKKYRSRVNVVFRILDGNTELEEIFINCAKKAGIVQIRAHVYNPGIRTSMYNALPVEAVVYLTNFMRTFMKKYPKKTNPTNAKMWNCKNSFILY